jgi:hypothetical protein
MSLRKLLLLPVLTATALAAAAGAGATSGVTVTGTQFVTSVTQLAPPRYDHGNLILYQLFSGTKSGLWNWSDTVKLVIRPNGRWTAVGHGTFAGPAPGCGDVSGAWEIEGRGTVNPDGSLKGGGHAHSIAGSTSPRGFRFTEAWAIDGLSGPYTITYACGGDEHGDDGGDEGGNTE